MPDQPAYAATLPSATNTVRTGAGAAIFGVLFAAIILAHAGLLPLSRWQADEYLYAALLRQGGVHYVADRFVHWAPRPWSEALLWVYGLTVNQLHRPLSARFVALLWAGLGLACVAPALQPSPRRLHFLAIGSALFALYLLGHPLAEMFFWPSGAAAYLPTLAAITWLFWCLSTTGRPVPVRQAGLALLLAAGCSEVGLLFVLSFAACTVFFTARRGARNLAWMVPGVALAGIDLWLLLHGRVGASELGAAGDATYHHLWPSLRDGLFGLPAEMLMSGVAEAKPGDFIAHTVAWGSVVLGARWSLGPLPRGRAGDLAALIAALVITAVLSRAAAYYQFGMLCCQRHETMRHCLILPAVLASGAWSRALWSSDGKPPAFGLPMLGLAAALLIGPRVAPLIATYRQMPAVLSARAATWHAGLQPGTDMVFTMEPGSPMLPELGGFSPGVTRLDQAPPWYDRGVMLFFNKRVLTIVRPSA